MKLQRPRRLRNTVAIRDMVRETTLDIKDLVYPLFIIEGEDIKEEISSMPDVYRYSLDRLEEEINEIVDLGIKYVILFGIPKEKDPKGSQAYAQNGIVQEAIRKIKSINKDLYVITDVCMCEFTSHGHCGIISEEGEVINDITLEYISEIALSHAQAGADMVAPSDMMDFRIEAMRRKLDENGFKNILIMAYSAKYASAYYGPFRDAADSAPSFGDRKSYQMDPGNTDEAMREIAMDIEEGADIVMVKPALSYLDVIRRAKDRFELPIAAYNVSGEYSMLKFAIKQGLMSENVMMETILSIKRAGASIIITYFAKDVARILKGVK